MKPVHSDIPINGRMLIQVDPGFTSGVDTSLGKQHENSKSTGVVLSVASDADEGIKQLYYKGKDIPVILPSELVGKKVRWHKYDEQNTLFDGVDQEGKPCKLTVLEYKDIISYEA